MFHQRHSPDTTEPVDDSAPQPLPAAHSPADARPTEVLITTQQVLFSTAAAAGVRRENTGGGLFGIVRRIFATSTKDTTPAVPALRRSVTDTSRTPPWHAQWTDYERRHLARLRRVMVMFAAGIYNLQWWLERTDYERHFED